MATLFTAKMEDAEEPPALELGAADVALGKVVYERAVVRSFSVKNTGRIPCQWRVVPVDSNSPPAPEWMTMEPSCGLLLPGEETIVTLRGLVSQRTAGSLNLDARLLDHTVIIHALGGKDYFNAVSGDYEPTCFGNALETLNRLPGSIRKLKGVSNLFWRKIVRAVMRVKS